MLAVGSLRTIGVMNADGSNMGRYRYYPAFDPDWSPDGRSLVFSMFSSRVADEHSQVGSRMRIYLLDRAKFRPRQLIPEAVNPVLPSYWDYQAAWWRGAPKSP